MRQVNEGLVEKFKQHLQNEERAFATIEKYCRDISAFMMWCREKEITKAVTLSYKAFISDKFAPSSVNSIISSLNSFFDFMGWLDVKLKSLKIQRQMFANKEKELSKNEYERLLHAAKLKQNEKLFLLMQTICSSGIRVSELKFITTDAIKDRKAIIKCKGKTRIVFLPKDLCKLLLLYVKKRNIKEGPVFVTKNGNPLDRSNIWKLMKSLCESANVSKNKVFPHNLRHLFARTYYNLQKDIVRLADVLGHSSIETTRIYTMETGEIHQKQIQKLGLLKL